MLRAYDFSELGPGGEFQLRGFRANTISLVENVPLDPNNCFFYVDAPPYLDDEGYPTCFIADHSLAEVMRLLGCETDHLPELAPAPPAAPAPEPGA